MSTSCRTQIPLRHAWALAVHKSQGLTLHSVQVDMANMRTPGQAYVALSRAPSLGQLPILHFNPMVLAASAEAKRFYETLKQDGCVDHKSDRRPRIEASAAWSPSAYVDATPSTGAHAHPPNTVCVSCIFSVSREGIRGFRPVSLPAAPLPRRCA
ncbi:hypothetical protein GH5_01739 [Leishmania sp. Ghana 2012 LV757]|uniref:hypothetical protein n=1 Tax=Leishmania sp. Ghana 2012 LV757 TaxID=2803181 RepID=UPI001B4C999F|nr:hypothetical protein GH5_01739 [Leishmania sp. Ghana 2012 LV757]